MKCPYLSDEHRVSCTVEDAEYVPSIFQLEEYYLSASHKKCPLSRREPRKKAMDSAGCPSR